MTTLEIIVCINRVARLRQAHKDLMLEPARADIAKTPVRVALEVGDALEPRLSACWNGHTCSGNRVGDSDQQSDPH
jgi:hypothetical protein